MDLVEDFVNFGTKQASLVFGENSALSQLILSGFGPLIENIDSIFNALESLINFKRNILDTFLSENYDREKLLRKSPIKPIHSPFQSFLVQWVKMLSCLNSDQQKLPVAEIFSPNFLCLDSWSAKLGLVH